MSSSHFGDWFSRVVLHEAKKALKRVLKSRPPVPSKSEPKDLPDPQPSSTPESPSVKTGEKTHPWRLCEVGRFWRETHTMHVPVSAKNPGGVTSRSGNCANNPSRGKYGPVRDYIEQREIHIIAETYFATLSGAPKSNSLGFPKGNEFDALIRGWTKYWNEVLKPSDPLDPDLVKSLIASESSFNPEPQPQDAKKAGKARGLIQLTDEAIRTLSNFKGELRDHFIKMERSDANDPPVCICAGIRWLFHKKKMASHFLKREADWVEAIAAYKGCLPAYVSGKKPGDMNPFHREYAKIKK